jgi:YHS domain-containing protein
VVQFSRRLVMCVYLLGFFIPASAPSAEDATNSSRIVLSGYDPVSYFTEGKPEKGLAELSASYDNGTYWFKNADHRATFVANPDRYAPQFGGLCAVDLSRGIKTEPDPEAWTIADGKLYVFSDKRGPSFFAEQGPSIVEAAAKNFPTFK